MKQHRIVMTCMFSHLPWHASRLSQLLGRSLPGIPAFIGHSPATTCGTTLRGRYRNIAVVPGNARAACRPLDLLITNRTPADYAEALRMGAG
ncbi:hypothetical protein GCM10009760_61530 [Kitasatospora kazusensis]|uniref:Uncharacterized protein n=1 Tax=Kitasatospora kazusensis TaxID=407974 RepID=A0ABN3AB89_9ACTN